ncbi:MAG: tetratricopeptide repeat protein [Bradyrhizobium sp.]
MQRRKRAFYIALKLKPDDADVWVRLGDLSRQQRSFQDALLAYDRAVLLDPRHLDAVNKSGLLLIELQRHGEALTKFEQSHAIHPGRPETLIGKGVCLQALKRLEEAAACYTMALAAQKTMTLESSLATSCSEWANPRKPSHTIARRPRSIPAAPLLSAISAVP